MSTWPTTVKRVRKTAGPVKATPKWPTEEVFDPNDWLEVDDCLTEDEDEETSSRFPKTKTTTKVSYGELDAIAEAALQELDDNGIIDVLILKNDKVRDWWAPRKAKLDAERARREAEERDERLRQDVLRRLSDEERRVLGLK